VTALVQEWRVLLVQAGFLQLTAALSQKLGQLSLLLLVAVSGQELLCLQSLLRLVVN
jgi:hypothetical protein